MNRNFWVTLQEINDYITKYKKGEIMLLMAKSWENHITEFMFQVSKIDIQICYKDWMRAQIINQKMC